VLCFEGYNSSLSTADKEEVKKAIKLYAPNFSEEDANKLIEIEKDKSVDLNLYQKLITEISNNPLTIGISRPIQVSAIKEDGSAEIEPHFEALVNSDAVPQSVRSKMMFE
jgi:hypothetical protein